MNMNKILFSLVMVCLGTMEASAQHVLNSEQVAFTSETPAAPLANTLEFPSTISTQEATTLDAPYNLESTTKAEAPRSRQRYAPRRSFSPRFAALADIGIGGAFDMNATLGAQLFRFFYLGGGLNTTYWYDGVDKEGNHTDVNLIINPRFEIPTPSIVTPYIDFKTGLALTHSHSTYWSIGAGVQIKQFVVGLGFSVQTVRERYFHYYGEYLFGDIYDYSSNESLTLRFGMKF